MPDEDIFVQTNWPADLASLSAIQDCIEKAGKAAGFSAEKMTQINIAIEELVVNIITHGFEDARGQKIEMALSDQRDRLTVLLQDAGIPFDPTQKKATETADSLEDQPIGGLGLTLVRNFIDRIEYQRKNDHNILTLTIFKKH